MNALTVVGARPQFVKAAALGRALRRAGHTDFLVHTGQHYDYQMSGVFFEELGIAPPNLNLEVGSGSHGAQTGEMLAGLEQVMLAEKPDCVVVLGDTNSTLAGALAASKLGIPLAHVEAGLRSFNRRMPEEHNRVLTDHCSDLLFCPTTTAVRNLEREGITNGVFQVGDIMYDSVLHFATRARQQSTIVRDLGLTPGEYLVATVHRAYNADEPEILRGILDALHGIAETVVFPVHPRTRRRIAELNGTFRTGHGDVRYLEPLGYLDMLALESAARVILTDSGGMQKEAFFLSVPCVTLRPETEWVETVEAGWNVLAGTDPNTIVRAVKLAVRPDAAPPTVFGVGNAAEQIVTRLSARTS